MDINTYRMKKEWIVRAIQQAENSMACFATERVGYCNEDFSHLQLDVPQIPGIKHTGPNRTLPV